VRLVNIKIGRIKVIVKLVKMKIISNVILSVESVYIKKVAEENKIHVDNILNFY